MTLQAWNHNISLDTKEANQNQFNAINSRLAQAVWENILCNQHLRLWMVHQLAVEVLVRMRDPAQNFCTVGKMEEVEGTMMMWPLPSCHMQRKTRYQYRDWAVKSNDMTSQRRSCIIPIFGFSLLKLSESNKILRYMIQSETTVKQTFWSIAAIFKFT